MDKRSCANLKAGEVGDNVTVPIPMVNRGRGDPEPLLKLLLIFMKMTCAELHESWDIKHTVFLKWMQDALCAHPTTVH